MKHRLNEVEKMQQLAGIKKESRLDEMHPMNLELKKRLTMHMKDYIDAVNLLSNEHPELRELVSKLAALDQQIHAIAAK